MGRMVAQNLSESLGRPVVLETQSGAGGAISAEMVARAAPDGHTLALMGPQTMLVRKHLVKNVPYDPIADFTPIGQVVETTAIIVSYTGLPASSLREVIDYARRNPGKLSYGSSGNGSYFHLLGEHFNNATGIDIVHTAYKNIATAVSDVAGGHLPMVYTAVASTRPLIAAGKMKVIGVFLPFGYPGRYPQMPQHASVNETLADYRKPPSWFAYFGPAGMAAQQVTRLNSEILKGANTPEVKKILEEAGFVILSGSPQEFGALYRDTFEVYGRIVKAAGLKPE